MYNSDGKISGLVRKVREVSEDQFMKEFGHVRTKHFLSIITEDTYIDYVLQHKPLTIRVKKGETNEGR